MEICHSDTDPLSGWGPTLHQCIYSLQLWESEHSWKAVKQPEYGRAPTIKEYWKCSFFHKKCNWAISFWARRYSKLKTKGCRSKIFFIFEAKWNNCGALANATNIVFMKLIAAVLYLIFDVVPVFDDLG